MEKQIDYELIEIKNIEEVKKEINKALKNLEDESIKEIFIYISNNLNNRKIIFKEIGKINYWLRDGYHAKDVEVLTNITNFIDETYKISEEIKYFRNIREKEFWREIKRREREFEKWEKMEKMKQRKK